MWIVIGIVAYFILRVVFSFAVSYWQSLNPVEEAPPTVIFGPIPPPQFLDTLSKTAGLNLNLLTIEGGPQEATSTGKVYFMPKKLPSLLTSKRARETAGRLKFSVEPAIVSYTLYRFSEGNRTLELDTVNNNFVYTYRYQSDDSFFSQNTAIETNKALSLTTAFFQSAGIVDSSIYAKNNVVLLSYSKETDIFTPTTNMEVANAARVNYFRADVDGLALLPPEYNLSYIYAVVSPSNDESKKIIRAEYKFWPIDFNNFGTYPLRTSLSSWEDIKEGRGVVATFGQNPKEGEIIIRKVYLAYYDSGMPENYLQPIFVFEGDNGFIAYTSAIDPQYLTLPEN